MARSLGPIDDFHEDLDLMSRVFLSTMTLLVVLNALGCAHTTPCPKVRDSQTPETAEFTTHTPQLLSPGDAWTANPHTNDTAELELQLGNGEAAHLSFTASDQTARRITVLDPSGVAIAQEEYRPSKTSPLQLEFTASRAGIHSISIAIQNELESGTPPPNALTVTFTERIDAKTNATAHAKARYESPAIFELWQALRDDPNADRAFVERHGGRAIIEALPETPGHSRVTFYALGTAHTAYAMLSGGPDFLGRRTQRVGSSNIFFVSQSIADDARFPYSINLYERRSAGPNADIALTHTIYGPMRALEMPSAAPALHIQPRAGVARGQSSPHELISEALAQTRPITVYTPPNYDPARPHRLLIVFDGENFRAPPAAAELAEAWVPTPTILDNLVASGEILPTVAVFVDTLGRRRRELTAHEGFTNFVAHELIPWVRAHYAIAPGPQAVVAAGASFGAVAACYLALEHTNKVGNVLSQSGAYYLTEALAKGEHAGRRRPFASIIYPEEIGLVTQALQRSERLSIRFYMEVGRYDVMAPSNRELRAVLEGKGYDLEYHEFNGGHAYLNWRASLARGLAHLLGPDRR